MFSTISLRVSITTLNVFKQNRRSSFWKLVKSVVASVTKISRHFAFGNHLVQTIVTIQKSFVCAHLQSFVVQLVVNRSIIIQFRVITTKHTKQTILVYDVKLEIRE